MSRLPRGSRARAVVFVVTVVVVVAAVAVGPGLLARDAPAETPEYAVDALVPERAPAEGELAIDRRNETGTVLIDTKHANRMSVDEMQPLLSTITAAGYEVDLLEPGEGLDESLSRADAFVIIDPAIGYNAQDAARVEAFVERGGRLLLVGEPTQSSLSGFSLITQRDQLSPLASRFGLEFGEAYLFNMHRNDGNHLNVFAEPAGPSVVTSGLTRTALYTATTVQIREGQPVLVASEQTRSSRTDATGTYTVGAVNGNVLALGDGTFLKRGNFNVVDNEQLVRNVVRFLISGSKTRPIDTYPAFIDHDPWVHYTGPALLPAAQTLGNDLRERGLQPRLILGGRNVGPARTDVLVTTFDFLAERGQLGTGIVATDRRVRVAGYESNATGIIVIRAPASGIDLVIAADTPGRARQAASLLADGDFREHPLNDRTIVVRTDDAIRLVFVGDGTGG